ncbi:hypothetical protein FC83_GL002058 [Agrilactobacillus composti DSM 18527 = JCM 14202]|uniref:PTS EIIB type-3 domain-containing protein n=1 Tax=Agrilactobacillus composti DSM 18527 = JCM 14202 TaxID=1423734 RepID=X0PP78_9LACO|nr:PTS sugar transporter subunit IIB [Agrilactobacillus composti]KRM34918.1 hypothetical protein FC83_GL002058 [Agrilactobacillus composti DSM 18527 = JCM 14202]GAF38801.1 PTS system, cellobiose-specific IIB component [Agrilactobacillus composti DSM 18527 = JCM 14202]
MTESKIMLVCAAGMSTSLLVQKMKDAASAQGITTQIFATASSDADEKLASEKPDVLMLGPQVAFLLKDFQAKANIPVKVIKMQDYGMMNGEKVLADALDTIKTAQ